MVLGRYSPASMAFGRASPTKMNSSGTMRFDNGSAGKPRGNFFTDSFLPWVDKAVRGGLEWISPHLRDAYDGVKEGIQQGKPAGDIILGALDTGRHAADDILDKIPGGAAFKPIASAVNNAIDAAKPGFQNKNPVGGIISGAQAAINTPGAIQAVRGKRSMVLSQDGAPPAKKPNIDVKDMLSKIDRRNPDPGYIQPRGPLDRDPRKIQNPQFKMGRNGMNPY
jgi:hypothetical protein